MSFQDQYKERGGENTPIWKIRCCVCGTPMGSGGTPRSAAMGLKPVKGSFYCLKHRPATELISALREAAK